MPNAATGQSFMTATVTGRSEVHRLHKSSLLAENNDDIKDGSHVLIT